MPVLDVFGLEFANYLAIFEFGTLKYFCWQNFTKKQKCPNLTPKMPYLGIFDRKWLVLGKNCKKAITIFEISTLNLVYLHKFMKKKCLNDGPKMNDLGIFGQEFKNNIVVSEISTFKFVYLQIFTKKPKCLNLGPEMPARKCFSKTVF